MTTRDSIELRRLRAETKRLHMKLKSVLSNRDYGQFISSMNQEIASERSEKIDAVEAELAEKREAVRAARVDARKAKREADRKEQLAKDLEEKPLVSSI